MEAKFNTVGIFGGYSSDPGPARIFRLFLATAAPGKGAWFNNVLLRFPVRDNLVKDILEPASDLSPIADFCRRCSYVNIRYILGGFEYERSGIDYFTYFGLLPRCVGSVHAGRIKGLN